MAEQLRGTPQNIHTEPRVERKEAVQPSYMPFLGGMLSAGGEMGLYVTHHTAKKPGAAETDGFFVTTSVTPKIFYPEVKQGISKVLVDTFGGSILHKDTPHIGWGVSGEEAVLLARQVRDFAPSRAPVVDAFEEWLREESLKKKVEIAQALKAQTRRRMQNIPKEAYAGLVENPMFLAGVFQFHGVNEIGLEDGTEHRHTQIDSVNTGLLVALKNKFGGVILLGEKMNHLVLEPVQSGRLIKIIEPHLLVPEQ